jgi:hypothetical protein
MHIAATLEQTAPDRVTLIGEPVGDRMSFWSEGGVFTLPNTNLIATYTGGRHNFSGSCRDLDVCFWPTAHGGRYAVSVRSLAPDIYVPFTFAAYREGRDTALERVVAIETSHAPQSVD